MVLGENRNISRPIILVGFMGCGKSVVGKSFASDYSLRHIDLDSFIESRYMKTIKQLFESNGESGFREIERDVLVEVADFESIVLSTGGGAPCFFDNIDVMNEKGVTIYLKTSPEELYKRVYPKKDVRPLLRNLNDAELLAFIKQMLEKRECYYNKAQIVINTDGLTIKEINNKIYDNLRIRNKNA